jgi:hypothetical protein
MFLLVGYVYIVSTDPEGSMLGKAQQFYGYCQDRYKKMDLKYEVNSWPQESSKNAKKTKAASEIKKSKATSEIKKSRATKDFVSNSRKQRNF